MDVSTSRAKISLMDSTKDVVVKMSEGNPGALSVLMQLLTDESGLGLTDVLHLDDMNLRGSQIWVGYKYHCHEDIEAFRGALRDRDAKMVETINKECLDHHAVVSGASFR